MTDKSWEIVTDKSWDIVRQVRGECDRQWDSVTNMSWNTIKNQILTGQYKHRHTFDKKQNSYRH